VNSSLCLFIFAMPGLECHAGPAYQHALLALVVFCPLQKNAFVLLGQHRHELAAAFFILGGYGATLLPSAELG
jgi:hypothetical protein